MANFNRVILAGNLTRDPQLSYTPANTAVCEFGMAINRRWRDRDGNQQEDVCYVDVNAFAGTAETINKYFTKGKPILIEGRLRYRQWTNKEGQNRSKLEVVAETFSFIDSGGGGGGRGQGGGGGGAYQGGGGGGYSGGGGGGQGAPRRTEANDPPPTADDAPAPADPDIPF